MTQTPKTSLSEKGKLLTGYTVLEQKVWATAKRIPHGRVATYADIARLTGAPKAVRAVGNSLNKNPYRSVPCHRVVRSDGLVGGYACGLQAKIQKLSKEGIEIADGKINLNRYRMSRA